ncbi:MAG: YfiR family protein [Candidatus Acidiferrales bacterium]|jgi:hypothetical protein
MAEKLNLRRTGPSHPSSGAAVGRRGKSKLALRFFVLQMILFSSAHNFPTALPAQVRPPSEYELKAAFLFNFAKFVDWPKNAFAGPESPFLVCILGIDPFGSALDNALRGKVIAEHPASVARLKRVADISGCQILFVAASESHLLSEVVAKLRGQSVLVIGETNDFASSGGAIQFTLEDNRVRFFINPDAADRAGLKISSKLLALAKIVRDAPAGGS